MKINIVYKIIGMILISFSIIACSIMTLEHTNQNDPYNLKSADIPRNGLIAEYLFTGNINDTSGNNNSGTLNGSVLTIDKFENSENAYYFDGVDDFINFGNILTNNFTSIGVSAWIKVISFPTTNAGILVKAGATSTTKDWMLDIHTGYPQFTVFEGNVGYYSSSPNTTLLNTWYHLVGVYDGTTKQTKIYVNGIEKDSDSHSILWSHTSQNLNIGYGQETHWLNGTIDNIRIYNRTLKDDEIQALYNELK